ncbi:MAG TPA: acyl-CoA dehydrogenase family protein, partial [Acidimicrobiales bacterium]
MRRHLFEDTHEQFRASFKAFVAKEMVPYDDEWERAGIVPREVFEAAGSHGFLGMAIPEAYGGGGVEDFRYNLVLTEELHDAGLNAAGLGITLHNDICLPYFLRYCTEEQRRRWLPGIAAGTLITAVAMTEPGMG